MIMANAIVNAAFSASERGRALGAMGGVAAVAGALGPTIGGVLTALSWRLVHPAGGHREQPDRAAFAGLDWAAITGRATFLKQMTAL